MEWWENGILENWNDGILESWNYQAHQARPALLITVILIFISTVHFITPALRYSITPFF